jgi:hypothetical protein
MAPANYTGGSLANSNFKLAGSAGTPLLEHVPIPQQATPGVVRGGGGKRIAPTPAPQHGFGQTAISRKSHAMSLTADQRKAAAAEYLEIVRTLREVADEEGDASWGFVVPGGEVQSKKRKWEGEGEDGGEE